MKTLWNRTQKPLTPLQLAVEKKLIPRLKLMGYIFLILSICSLLFPVLQEEEFLAEELQQLSVIEAIIATALVGDELTDGIELLPSEVLNFYWISILFVSLGLLCLWVARKKGQTFVQSTPPLNESLPETEGD
jgi:hypothetical protein